MGANVIFSINNTKQLGKAAQLTRKVQGLDQFAAASMSENGITFLSEFENGKQTVELGRVLRVLSTLGIKVTIDIPVDEASLTPKQQQQLAKIINEANL
ncbi:hypothetical protein AltI4_01040 [Alteromonas sp. I4]|nr:hypothetical protein AltI4_01040 [Alteromonas sp. I4]